MSPPLGLGSILLFNAMNFYFAIQCHELLSLHSSTHLSQNLVCFLTWKKQFQRDIFVNREPKEDILNSGTVIQILLILIYDPLNIEHYNSCDTFVSTL